MQVMMKETTFEVLDETALVEVTGGLTLRKVPQMNFQNLERGNFPQAGTGLWGSNSAMLGGGTVPPGKVY